MGALRKRFAACPTGRSWRERVTFLQTPREYSRELTLLEAVTELGHTLEAVMEGKVERTREKRGGTQGAEVALATASWGGEVRWVGHLLRVADTEMEGTLLCM